MNSVSTLSIAIASSSPPGTAGYAAVAIDGAGPFAAILAPFDAATTVAFRQLSAVPGNRLPASDADTQSRDEEFAPSQATTGATEPHRTPRASAPIILAAPPLETPNLRPHLVVSRQDDEQTLELAPEQDRDRSDKSDDPDDLCSAGPISQAIAPPVTLAPQAPADAVVAPASPRPTKVVGSTTLPSVTPADTLDEPERRSGIAPQNIAPVSTAIAATADQPVLTTNRSDALQNSIPAIAATPVATEATLPKIALEVAGARLEPAKPTQRATTLRRAPLPSPAFEPPGMQPEVATTAAPAITPVGASLALRQPPAVRTVDSPPHASPASPTSRPSRDVRTIAPTIASIDVQTPRVALVADRPSVVFDGPNPLAAPSSSTPTQTLPSLSTRTVAQPISIGAATPDVVRPAADYAATADLAPVGDVAPTRVFQVAHGLAEISPRRNPPIPTSITTTLPFPDAAAATAPASVPVSPIAPSTSSWTAQPQAVSDTSNYRNENAPASVAAEAAPVPRTSTGPTFATPTVVPTLATPVIATQMTISEVATRPAPQVDRPSSTPLSGEIAKPQPIQAQPSTTLPVRPENETIVAAAVAASVPLRPATPPVQPSPRKLRIEAPAIDIAITGITQPHAAPDLAIASNIPLDMGRHGWPQAMIERIEALRDAADAVDTSIRIVPDKLGTIDVSVRREGDVTHVHFTVEQVQTRNILADAQPRLAELADSRGLKLGQSSIDGGGAHQPQHDRGTQAFARPAPIPAPRDEAPTDHRIA